MHDYHKSLIIIGAPRSGTNILRDVLTSLDGFVTWPCDEINYIWRHGNVNHGTDELTVTNARSSVITYIQRQFSKLARKSNASVVVEKTCANSLRVGFVNRVIPDAKFIFLYRNGMDVAGSSLLRWKAPFDFNYVFAEEVCSPPDDFPLYASRYLVSSL